MDVDDNGNKVLRSVEAIDDELLAFIEQLKELSCITPVFNDGGFESGYLIDDTPLMLIPSHDNNKLTFLFTTSRLTDDYWDDVRFWKDEFGHKDPTKLGKNVPVHTLFDNSFLPEEMEEFLSMRISLFIDGDISDSDS